LGEIALEGRRRHTRDFLLVTDALVEPTRGGITGDDDLVASTIGEGSLLGVESEPGLALGFVGSMTREALVRDKGTDVTVEIDLGPSWFGLYGTNRQKRYRYVSRRNPCHWQPRIHLRL
jgi:hypothetical protein